MSDEKIPIERLFVSEYVKKTIDIIRKMKGKEMSQIDIIRNNPEIPFSTLNNTFRALQIMGIIQRIGAKDKRRIFKFVEDCGYE